MRRIDPSISDNTASLLIGLSIALVVSAVVGLTVIPEEDLNRGEHLNVSHGDLADPDRPVWGAHPGYFETSGSESGDPLSDPDRPADGPPGMEAD